MLIHRLRDQRSRSKRRRRLTQQKRAQKRAQNKAAQQASQLRTSRQRVTQPLIYPQRVMVAVISLAVGATFTVALMNSPLLYGILSQQGRLGVGGETLLPDRYVDGILPPPTAPQATNAGTSVKDSAQAPNESAPLETSSDQPQPRTKLSRPASPRLPVPRSMTPGTVIWVDGDSSLVRLSQLLRYEFKHRYPGTDIQVAANGSQAALQGVLNGSIDVAAIGRPLTDTEKAQGLVAVPMARHKIAVLIGTDNPFNGSLTNYQFAAILRGEMTNWEEVGGPDLPIRLIDRAEDSDTRQALLNYPIFSDVAEKMPPTTVRQPGDRLSDIAQNLGLDGITYALIDQVSDDITTPNIVNRGNVKIVPLHQVLPDDPRYSISQPMVYVYRSEKPSSEAKAFLGYATVLRRRGILADGASLNARRAWFETKTFAWSVLLLMSIGAWGFMRLRSLSLEQWPQWAGWKPLPLALPSTLENVEFYEDRASTYLILDGISGMELGARWQLLPKALEQLQAQGGKLLQLRLYEFKPGESLGTEAIDYRRRPFRQYSCRESERSKTLVVAHCNHRYLAEMGYLTADDRWLRLVTSTVITAESVPIQFLEEVSGLKGEVAICETARLTDREMDPHLSISQSSTSKSSTSKSLKRQSPRPNPSTLVESETIHQEIVPANIHHVPESESIQVG